jgi:transcriptional regulator with XRE-family HTH domain
VAADPYSSPLAFFTAKLKRLREHAGLTLDDVAKRTNFSLSTVSAYETGRRIASPDFAMLADELLGTGEELVELQKLVENVSLLPWFRERAEVERKASDIREYEPYQIPGLLQTEDYARAVMSVGRPKQSPEEIERAVALRMTRQEILEPRDDCRLTRCRVRGIGQ